MDIQLGLTPARDVGAALAGRAALADIATSHDPGGFDLIPGRSGSGAFSALDPAAVQRLLDAIRAMGARYDVILLDLGAGLDRSVRRLAAFADLLLVVATEEPTSLTDAYAVLKLHAADRKDGESRIVVNQASSRQSGERTYATLARACTTFLAGPRPSRASCAVMNGSRIQSAARHCC